MKPKYISILKITFLHLLAFLLIMQLKHNYWIFKYIFQCYECYHICSSDGLGYLMDDGTSFYMPSYDVFAHKASLFLLGFGIILSVSSWLRASSKWYLFVLPTIAGIIMELTFNLNYSLDA